MKVQPGKPVPDCLLDMQVFMRREMRQVYDVSWIAVSLPLTTSLLDQFWVRPRPTHLHETSSAWTYPAVRTRRWPAYGTQISVRAGLQRAAGNWPPGLANGVWCQFGEEVAWVLQLTVPYWITTRVERSLVVELKFKFPVSVCYSVILLFGNHNRAGLGVNHHQTFEPMNQSVPLHLYWGMPLQKKQLTPRQWVQLPQHWNYSSQDFRSGKRRESSTGARGRRLRVYSLAKFLSRDEPCYKIFRERITKTIYSSSSFHWLETSSISIEGCDNEPKRHQSSSSSSHQIATNDFSSYWSIGAFAVELVWFRQCRHDHNSWWHSLIEEEGKKERFHPALCTSNSTDEKIISVLIRTKWKQKENVSTDTRQHI